MGFPRVSIVILNWNGWEDTIECLESIYRIDYPHYDVIVVDNGSTDDSVQKIKSYAQGMVEVSSEFFVYNPYNKPIKVFELSEIEAKQAKFDRPLYNKFDIDRRLILIKNERNYGFSEGFNIGIKFALGVFNPDYILLLNNDTVVSKEFLTELVKVLEHRSDIGIATPFIHFYNNPEKIQMGGERIRWGIIPYSKKLWYKDTREVIDNCEFATGVALCVRSQMLPVVGFLDDTKLLLADIDFHLRAIKAGYKVATVRKSKVFHKVSATAKKVPDIIVYYGVRDGIIIRKQHLSGIKKIYALSIIPIRSTATVLNIFRRNRGLKKDSAKTVVKALVDGTFNRVKPFVEEING